MKQVNAKYGASYLLTKIIMETLMRSVRPVVIAVGGPEFVGKHEFADGLGAEVRYAYSETTRAGVVDDLIPLRAYKLPRGERPEGVEGPHPDLYQIDLLREHLEAILSKQQYRKPILSFIDDRMSKMTKPVKFNFISGEIATYDALHNFVDFAVFMDADLETQVQRMMTDRKRKSDLTEDEAREMLLRSNAVFDEFGRHTKDRCDVHIQVGGGDRYIDIVAVDDRLEKYFIDA